MKILAVFTGWASDGKPYSIDVVHVGRRDFALYIQGEGVVRSYVNKVSLLSEAENIATNETALNAALGELRNPNRAFGPAELLY